ncbi:tyrosine-type recombinase/integrase [Paraburkholderia heleia]|uniref:tyrosine-type recombinase/integrase n=1 Tax=Paraburkholderia heleia TaxID=634127 RepID=UPI002AB61EF9|nr:tyrosine-type recombinase/integrase [Paraburkholderia heleia]
MASITKYKDGWRAFVTVGGKRTTRTFATKREAAAWAAAEETTARERKALPESELHSVRDMLSRYAREVSPRKKGSRPERLRIAAFLRNFPLLADKKLSDIRTPDLAAWRDARLGGFFGPSGERVQAVSSASVLRDIAWLSNAFTVAKNEWHWIEHKPFEGLRPPPAPPPRDRRVSPAEVKRICRRLGYVTGRAPTSKQQEVALAFLVGLRSAMRAGEILSLGAGNLDLTKRIATVAHKTQHLTGKPRVVPLTRQAVRLLRAVASREHCFTVSSATLDTLFRKARDQLLIIGLHFHDSRAEALTRLARKVDVMTLAKISGHKDLSILQNTYYRESAEEIAARL